MLWRAEIRRMWSADLTGSRLDDLVANGYQWVRVVPRPWRETLRSPTTGRRLEFSLLYQPGATLVSTGLARRWMWSVCGI
jgi:hypothetical protein